VKNTAYNREGKVVSTITGEARIAPGKPAGRLIVAFGPTGSGIPNYYVLHVDEDYRYAVVGVPDRKSLWVLSRRIPIPEEKLAELLEIAKDAGFDVTKLIVAPWGKVEGSHD
jgi:apolipoprotein D and lipocalin family protein